MALSEPSTRPADGQRGASRLSLFDPRWVDFVEAHPQALIFHRPAWAEMIASSYGYERFALCLLDDDEQIAGGLPVIATTAGGLRRKKRWVSLPFSDFCPPLLAVGTDPSDFTQAIGQARLEAGVQSLSVRAPLVGLERQQVEAAVVHTTSLERDTDALFKTFHRSQVQRNLRRAAREPLTVRHGSERDDLTGSFYRLHLQTRRRLGMPVQPRRFFRAIWEELLEPGYGWLLLVEHDSKPVAAAVFLTGGDTVTYKYGASDSAFWSMRPNHLLFAEAIRQACAQGYSRFDWGRSDLSDHGLREFKSGWAGVETPLAYTTLADGEPRQSEQGSSRALSAARVVLRHSPAWVCRAGGELFYRHAA